MRTTVVAVVMVMVVMVQAIKPLRDFDPQRFAGKWYRVGLAYDSPSFAPYRDKLKVSMGTITLTSSGNFNLTMWDATPLGCQVKSYLYEKTSTPGLFTYFSTRHNMVKDITVVDTNYTDYALVLKHKVFNREYTQVALYGRSPRVKHEVFNKFRAFAFSRSFPRDSILTPPPAENCPASGSGR
ncbi:neutrophil gelatinase-associated lipocalin [Cynoglossus semilaevis]|uniref:Prostaglandin D2 synthase a n=1 Tax=Cynoglossus semilaevis TaxID=244447 RepID=A0A3P8WJG9_CYNSE|nr:neutrophil gelatinase-associated lipocalin [Cynoglossus semilaevis]